MANHERNSVLATRILVDYAPGSRSATQETIEKMRNYASILWLYSQSHELPPVFISVLPDLTRIVINLEDEADARKLRETLTADENFQTRENQFIPGDWEFYSKGGVNTRYEVKVMAQRKARMC
ncbi:MAG: hypothetical protein WCI72_02940 [archaeon]